MWLGYQAPSELVSGASAREARSAADDLRESQNQLRERNPNHRLIVAGHSYGSTVGGYAAKDVAAGSEGLAADALVLVGSPGAGVSHSSALHLSGDNPQIYAVTGTADPIGLAANSFGGIHGVDPTGPVFGATVWDSNSDHSQYWKDPAFLENLSAITTP